MAVKRLVGKISTLSLSQAEARLQIQRAANRAVKRISEFKPWKLQTPVEMKIEYYPGAAGVLATTLNRGESKQAAPRTPSPQWHHRQLLVSGPSRLPTRSGTVQTTASVP